MSNRDDQGGRPPPDDRTLLDPLSNDELEALRKARQRLQAQRPGPGAEAKPRQMVVGPEDESLGSAPTRAMPALPSFDGKVSLDEIEGSPRQRVSGPVQDPASRPSAGPSAAPSEPMSVYSGTVGPSSGDIGEEPTLAPGAAAPPPGSPTQAGPSAGPTGFGENTLMWMQPPKVSSSPAPATVDVLPGASSPPSVLRRVLRFGSVLGLVMVVLAVAAAAFFGGASGVVNLRTEPEGATVKIDGEVQAERTPVRLTMSVGEHTLEVGLQGYASKTIPAVVREDEPQSYQVTLDPLSRAGFVTVGVEVQPVAAKITVDGEVHEAETSLKVPNLDPDAAHTIVVEAPGYKTIEKDIPPGELKTSYTFVLPSDPSARPE